MRKGDYQTLVTYDFDGSIDYMNSCDADRKFTIICK